MDLVITGPTYTNVVDLVGWVELGRDRVSDFDLSVHAVQERMLVFFDC